MIAGKYQYSNVKRWSRNIPGNDIFQLDKIFVPINIRQYHWTCVVIYMQKKCIKYYDAKHGNGDHYLNYLFRYLQDEWKDKKGYELPNKEDWVLDSTSDGIPKQYNDFDCGVFVCMFVNYIFQGLELSFREDDMPHFRKRIALSIMNNRVS